MRTRDVAEITCESLIEIVKQAQANCPELQEDDPTARQAAVEYEVGSVLEGAQAFEPGDIVERRVERFSTTGRFWTGRVTPGAGVLTLN